MSDWKEYIIIIISVATLVVAIAAYVVAKRSYKYAKDSEIKRLKNLIENKEAQLKSTEMLMRNMATNDAIIQRRMLEAEIEQLKLQLKNL